MMSHIDGMIGVHAAIAASSQGIRGEAQVQETGSRQTDRQD
jgi:hypothetical protein